MAAREEDGTGQAAPAEVAAPEAACEQPQATETGAESAEQPQAADSGAVGVAGAVSAEGGGQDPATGAGQDWPAQQASAGEQESWDANGGQDKGNEAKDKAEGEADKKTGLSKDKMLSMSLEEFMEEDRKSTKKNSWKGGGGGGGSNWSKWGGGGGGGDWKDKSGGDGASGGSGGWSGSKKSWNSGDDWKNNDGGKWSSGGGDSWSSSWGGGGGNKSWDSSYGKKSYDYGNDTQSKSHGGYGQDDPWKWKNKDYYDKGGATDKGYDRAYENHRGYRDASADSRRGAADPPPRTYDRRPDPRGHASAASRPGVDGRRRAIIVEGIQGLRVHSRDLEHAFGQVGRVEGAEVRDGRARITFKDPISAGEAVKRFNGGQLNDHTITVYFEGDEPPRPTRPVAPRGGGDRRRSRTPPPAVSAGRRTAGRPVDRYERSLSRDRHRAPGPVGRRRYTPSPRSRRPVGVGTRY